MRVLLPGPTVDLYGEALKSVLNGGKLGLLKAWPPTFTATDWSALVAADFTGYSIKTPVTWNYLDKYIYCASPSDFTCSGGDPQRIVGWYALGSGDEHVMIVAVSPGLIVSNGKKVRLQPSLNLRAWDGACYRQEPGTTQIKVMAA